MIVSACYPGHVVLTVIFCLQGATFPPNFDSCILRAACAYYMDELRYVSCDFVSAKSTVDINPCGPILPNITSMLMFGLDNLRTPLRSAHMCCAAWKARLKILVSLITEPTGTRMVCSVAMYHFCVDGLTGSCDACAYTQRNDKVMLKMKLAGFGAQFKLKGITLTEEKGDQSLFMDCSSMEQPASQYRHQSFH